MFPLGDEGTPPARSFPIVNITIIVICILVYLLQLLVGVDQSIMSCGTIPYEILHNVDLIGNQGGLPQEPVCLPAPVYVTLFTSMFMHASLIHIGGNMLFLFIFGDNVEDNMGSLKYAIFYLLCGLIANFAQILAGPDSPIPGVGASGAIAGVMAAYLVLFPRAQVRTILGYGYVTRVPAIIMIGLWAVTQLFSGLNVLGAGSDVGGVAYWAHIGGFISGLVLVFIFGDRRAAGGFSLGLGQLVGWISWASPSSAWWWAPTAR
jgi:membrane associated rhomboid family serine protease